MQGHKRTYRFAAMSLLKDRMKQARKHAGLTQKDLAAAVGVSQPVISQLESGENLQSVHLLKIAHACRVNPAWLAEGVGEMLDAQASTPPAVDPAEAKQGAADIVLAMLKKHAAKGMSGAAQEKIAQAVADSLAEKNVVAAPTSNVIPADFSRPGPAGDEISIAHYDIRGAMGNGQVPADYPEMLRDVKVSQEQLRKLGVTYDDPNHLKMVYGWGHSMAPTIKHADPMIVNINIREFDGDGIFIFTWQEHLYVKRLQVKDAEHFEMISDNKQHKDRVIRMDETYIHARVLLVWNAHLV